MTTPARWWRRLRQFVAILIAAGVRPAIEAGRQHALPGVFEFIRAGGRIRGGCAEYRGAQWPLLDDYRTLSVIPGIVAVGGSVHANEAEVIAKVGGLTIGIPLTMMYSGLGMIAERFGCEEFRDIDVAGAVVVDIGANIGDSSLYFISRGAHQVLAFEPFGPTAEIAARNLCRNGVQDRVQLHVAGLGAQETRRRVAYVPETPHLASTVEGTVGVTNSASAIDVDLISLRSALDMARAMAGHRPIVLKVDCEGCEGELFGSQSDDLRGVRAAVIEAHSGPLAASTIDYFVRQGFQCKEIEPAVVGLGTSLIIASVGEKRN